MFINEKDLVLEHEALLLGFTYRELIDTAHANGESVKETFKNMLNESVKNAKESVELYLEKLEGILEETTYNGQEVFTEDTFSYDKAKVGDLVDADVVMKAMDCLPPSCMRLDCAQLGEPYSHREDPDTGKLRATYATFKCIKGGWNDGVWEYRGHCFRGENTERGKDPVYCKY